MNLTYYEEGLYLPIVENRVNVLVIENTAMLVRVMEELKKQSDGKDGGFCLQKGRRYIPFKNMHK